ncbi:MAG: trypsin-like peptidase domain-containing protein [Candidatus Melainabacteria bacterium]|nr:trypsin-like peptidase domain-containing protein [Candidatus Melainabacteria bacterium]
MKISLQLTSFTAAVLTVTLALSCTAQTNADKSSAAKTSAATSSAAKSASAHSAAVQSAAVKTAVSAAKRAVNAANAAQSAARAAVATHMTPEEIENVRIYKDVNRAVVNISSQTTSEDVYLNLVPKEGFGSGVIISTDGYILTNNHVINGASSVRVTLFDGSSFPATLVGEDPTNDLAVIKINVPPSQKLTALPFGDSSNLEVGRRVLAIGNPFGLDRTMSSGIISSIGRTLKTEKGRLIKGIIQTDAAINPGNSGGPLLDSSGHFIGITTAIFSNTKQSAGIGLVIPINIAKRIVPELIAHHGVSRPDLGIELFERTDKGLRIIRLDPKGPAATAGLFGPRLVIYRDGDFVYQSVDRSLADVITGVDDRPIKSQDDLLSYVEQKKAGQVVTLTVLRSGKSVKIPVKLSLVSSDW